MSRLVSFFGADHKTGTSQLALCTAKRLASVKKDSRVLLVNAQEKLGDDYTPMIGESMERIRPYLSENIADYPDIFKRCRYKKNLFIIGGANTPGSSGLFHPDNCSIFLSTAKEYFDYIICDCGAEIEHGLALGALFSSDIVFFVLAQSESCLRRFEWLSPVLDKLGLNESFIVINKFSSSSAYDMQYICGRLSADMEKICSCSYSEYGDEAECSEKSLISYRHKSFRRDIDRMIKKILQ